MASNFAVEAVFRAVDRMTAPINRMQNRMGRFTRSLDTGLHSVNNRVNGMLGALGKGAAGLAAMGAAAAGLVAVVDGLTQADVLAQNLAKSVNLNVDTLDALSAAIKPAGFEFESIIDLVEELNNKIGESKGLEEIGAVEESLQILGLRFADIKRLSPEEQFKAVADAALQMEDAQQAAAAADILMGGEANKILTILRDKGATIDDITGKYKVLSFRTEESRAGAQAFQDAMNTAKGVAYSLAQEIAGLSGNALGPLNERMQDWIKDNKAVIQSQIQKFVEDLTDSITWLVDNFEDIVKWTKRIAVGIGIFLAFVMVLKTFILVMTAVNLVMAMNPFGLMVLAIVALIAAVALMITYWEDVSNAFKNAGAWVDYLILALAMLTGPIGWLISAALFIYRHWDVLGPMFTALWAGITAVFSASIEAIKAWWAGLVADFAAQWSAMKSQFQTGVDYLVSLGDALQAAWSAVGSFFSGLWEGIKSAFASAVDFIASKISWITDKANALLGLANKVGNFFGGGGGSKVQVVTPQARNAKASQGSNSTVTIQDKTSRASVTSGRLAPGVSLARTGGM